MHLSSTTLLVLASTTHAFTPAGPRPRAQSLEQASGGMRDNSNPPAAAPTTAKATGEHQIKAGDHVRLHYTLTTTSGLARRRRAPFDTEEVDLVVMPAAFYRRSITR